MRSLNRNHVKTYQIGEYTLKINEIFVKLQKSLSGEQNVAAGEQIIIIIFIKIPTIIILSASRGNRSRENCDASKNRLFFPPLITN